MKNDSELRLALLTGLRLFAESSSNMMLGLAAFFISLIAVVAVVVPNSASWYPLVLVPVVAVILLVLCLYIPASVALETRRKNAIVWLKAIEEPTR